MVHSKGYVVGGRGCRRDSYGVGAADLRDAGSAKDARCGSLQAKSIVEGIFERIYRIG